jgi:hypothetical protein
MKFRYWFNAVLMVINFGLFFILPFNYLSLLNLAAGIWGACMAYKWREYA